MVKNVSRMLSGNVLLESAYPLIGVFVLLESRLTFKESATYSRDSSNLHSDSSCFEVIPSDGTDLMDWMWEERTGLTNWTMANSCPSFSPLMNRKHSSSA